MYLDILHIVFSFLYLSLASCLNTTGPVQCLDGCSMTPALLGQDPTIGGCCGLQGRNGGGFLLADAIVCISCTNFRTLTAQITHSTDPIMPEVGTNVTLMCQVQVEELLCPSGTLSLQIANGTVITAAISSSETKIIFNINPFTAEDFGKYYCNITLLSPQFPQVGLRAFQGFDLEGEIPTSSTTSTTTTSSATTPDATTPDATISVATSTATAATTAIIATTITDFVSSTPASPTDIPTTVTDSMGTSTVPTTNTIQPTTPSTTNGGSIPTTISITEFTTIQMTADTTMSSTTATTVSSDTPTVAATTVTLPTTVIPAVTTPPPSPLVLVIVCPKPPILGKPYELACISNRPNVQIQWLLSNEEPINNALIGSHIINNQTGLSSLILAFQSLSTEHVRGYICRSESQSVVVSLAFETNECMEKLDDCHHDAKCIDRKEGYDCVCKFGYYGNGTHCWDINECTGGKSLCHPRASCHNSLGSYFCHCDHGFRGSGRKCFYKKYQSSA